MSLKSIPLKVCVPLTLDDIIFLESDLSLIPLLIKALSSNLPQTQIDRIARIRKLLIDIKEDKNNKWYKYEYPGMNIKGL